MRQMVVQQTEPPELAPPQEHCFVIPVKLIQTAAFSLTVASQTQEAVLLLFGLSLVFI
jgi:hypothetical protein